MGKVKAKKVKAMIVMLAAATCFVATAHAEETKPMEAAINQCVKITMSVKGCGDNSLSPCESSFCYQTYDFALLDLDAVIPMGAIASPRAEKHSDVSSTKKKSSKHRPRA